MISCPPMCLSNSLCVHVLVRVLVLSWHDCAFVCLYVCMLVCVMLIACSGVCVCWVISLHPRLIV